MPKSNCRCELCMSQKQCRAEKQSHLYVHVKGQGNPPELTAETSTYCGGCRKKDRIIALMAECMLGEEKPDKKKVQDCIDYYTIVAEEGKDATAG